MSEKRFSKLSSSIDYFDVWDSVEEKGYTVDEVVDLLNEQQATIDKQDKAIREALKVLADSKNYQSVISFKYGLQYATKLLKRVIDDE